MHHWPDPKRPGGFVQVVRMQWFYLPLPVIFWFAEGHMMPIHEDFAGYNTPTLGNLLLIPLRFLQAFHTSFIAPLDAAFILPSATLLLLLTALARHLLPLPERTHAALPGRRLLLVGMASLFLGVFAYLAVAKVPYLHDWHSRHQLLVPLGAAFLLLGALYWWWQRQGWGPATLRLVMALLLALLVVRNLTYGIDHLRDWQKQSALLLHLTQSETARQHHDLAIIDRAAHWNATQRSVRLYEYTGLFERAFGDQTRMAHVEGQQPKHLYKSPFKDLYHVADYAPGAPTLLEVRIDPGPLDLTPAWTVLRLTLLEWLQPARHQTLLMKTLRLSYKVRSNTP